MHHLTGGRCYSVDLIQRLRCVGKRVYRRQKYLGFLHLKPTPVTSRQSPVASTKREGVLPSPLRARNEHLWGVHSEPAFGVCVQVTVLVEKRSKSKPVATSLKSRESMVTVAMHSIRAALRSERLRSACRSSDGRGSFDLLLGSPPHRERTRARRRVDEARRLARWPWRLRASGENASVSSSGSGDGEWWFSFSSFCKSCKMGCRSPARNRKGDLSLRVPESA